MLQMFGSALTTGKACNCPHLIRTERPIWKTMYQNSDSSLSGPTRVRK